jgi:hypothetical protein
MFKSKKTGAPLFHFRWKYAFSLFLVCGVLSFSLGRALKPDFITKDAAAIKHDYDALFLIDKDPKTATRQDLDGPAERTFELDSPRLMAFTTKLRNFGQEVSDESFRRAVDDRNTVGSKAIVAVANAAEIYEELELNLYRNYVRVAHDAKFKTYKTTNLVRSFFETAFLGLVPSAEKEVRRWAALNADAMKADGARGVHYTLDVTKPNGKKESRYALDVMNIKLAPIVGQVFFGNKKKVFNIRNVKDDDGNYTQVELFVTSYEKQMAEYEALARPRSKEGYLKLLQFAAIREALTNRWAIRRMDGTLFGPRGRNQISFSDRPISACAPDLVSFPSAKGGTVNDLEAYSSLWQEDRVNDLTHRGIDVAVAATENVPLLSDAEYADLFVKYVKDYPSFISVADGFGGDARALLRSFQKTYSPGLKASEEKDWSVDFVPSVAKDGQKGFVPAREYFYLSNLPADDLSLHAVAERYADVTFQKRTYFLAHAIWKFAANREVNVKVLKEGVNPYASPKEDDFTTKTVLLFPEAKKDGAFLRALKVVKAYLAKDEKAWKAALAKRILAALQTKLGMDVPTVNGNAAGLGYTSTDDPERFRLYAEDVYRHANYGTRGLFVRKDAERLAKELQKRMNALAYCPPVPGAKCLINFERSWSEKIPPKDRKPGYYVTFAPFRNPAKLLGIKDFILPESPDQLAQFFRKKLEAVAKYDNSLAELEEPRLAARIARNPVVMAGMDRLFATIAGKFREDAQATGAAEGESCANILSSAGKIVAGGKNRKVASAGMSPPKVCTRAEMMSESEKNQKLLEAVIIPAAKEAYQAFKQGLATEATYKDPERTAKALQEDQVAVKDALKSFREKYAAQAKNPLVARYGDKIGREMMERQAKMGAVVAAAIAKKRETPAQKRAREASEKAAALKKKDAGYFHPGEDHSYDKVGGELYLSSDKDRREALQLYYEALGMLGISSEVVGATHPLKTSDHALPRQVVSWVTTESLIRQKVGNARLLERMVATVTDQLAMGQVLTQEAIARAPILSLKAGWDWKKNEKSPMLLDKLLKIYQPGPGLPSGDEYTYRFREMLTEAKRHDIGKVETFCRADIKAYRYDEDFRKMFVAISGIRNVLDTDPEAGKWDAAIQKESRTAEETLLEDYLDPLNTPFMIAILVAIIFQITFTGGAGAALLPAELAGIGTAGGAVGTAAAETVARKFIITMGKILFYQATGMGGMVTLIFTLQSVMMVSTYHFMLPPQMGFTFELANSRIWNMENGQFANMPMVDQEKLKKAIDELNSQQKMATLQLLGEGVQFRFFTIPGLKRTLGIVGQKDMIRIAANSSSEVVGKTADRSLAKLIEEKGTYEGMKEWKLARFTFHGLERATSIQGTKAAAEGLRTLFGDSLAHAIPKKATLLEVYEGVLAEEKAVVENLDRFAKSKVAEAEIFRLGSERSIEITQRIDALSVVRKTMAQAVREHEDQAFATVVVSKEYEATLARLRIVDDAIWQATLGGDKRMQGAALYAIAARETAQKRVEVTSRLIRNLKASPTIAGEAETASHFREMSKSAVDTNLILDILSPKKFMWRMKNKFLPSEVGAAVKRYAKDFDYLKEDHAKAAAWAKAIGSVVRTGQADLAINANGEVGSFDAADFQAHPENYSVYAVSAKALGIEKQQNTVQRLKKAGARTSRAPQ